jgi:glycosyltransferase involved in cell wall biosynthesis
MRLEFCNPPRTGLVSIIIPCYNAVRFLAETLETAFTQSYLDTEIVVIDDGSTDGSAALIQSFGERVKAGFGPNRGASATRNRGTVLSSGEFIQYLDADDLLAYDAVSRRVTALRATNADVAYSDWERFVEVEPGRFDSVERIVRRIEDVHSTPEIALITEFWAPPAAVMYRRSMVERIGPWKEWLPIIQDARFLQDAALAGGKFVYVPGVGAKYRVHNTNSLSRRSKSAFISDVFANAVNLQSVFEAKAGGITSEEGRALSQIYNYVARSLFFLDTDSFQKCIRQLYHVEPEFKATWPKIASLLSGAFGFKVARPLISLLTKLRQLS